MIVVDSEDATHKITVLPRYYRKATSNITVDFTNEDTRRNVSHTVSDIVIDDGAIAFSTDAIFVENATYSVKIFNSDINKVIFRGKVFATTQSKQNYTINE